MLCRRIIISARFSSLSISQALKKENVLIVDVRSPSEVAAGGKTVEGSVNIPVNEVMSANPKTIFGQDKSRPIVFYCRKGIRAADAAAYVSKLGFTNAFSATDAETVNKLMSN